MFPKKSDKKSVLDEAISEVLSHMAGVTADTEEYAAMVDQLVKLYALRDSRPQRGVSPDTLAIVAGNLLGILVIVGYEQKHVVTSTAKNLLLKTR